MCGIVGYVGHQPALDVVVDALRRMEYRGYDSAGIALVDGEGELTVRRRAGRLANLESALAETDPAALAVPPGWGTRAGRRTDVPPTATPTRTATRRARSPSSTTASSRTTRRCAKSSRPPVSSLPATPTPKSPSTSSPGTTTTARQRAISPPRCSPCCAASTATSPWCSPTPTSRAPSSPRAARRR